MRALSFSCLALLGCELIVRETVDQGCRTNADCTQGICYFRECVVPDADPLTPLAAEITPPAADTFLPNTATLPERVAINPRSGRLTLTSATPVLWAGYITDPSSSALAGRLHIRHEGERDAYTVVVDAGGRFRALLRPGNYNAVFEPNNQTFPPILLPAWVLEERRTDVPYTHPGNNIAVSGRIRTSPEDLTSPSINGAKVYATVDDTVLRSTIDLSDDSGGFLFFLSSATTKFTLHIGPSRENPFVPELEIPGYTATPGMALGDIFIGAIGSPVQVEGTLRSESGEPIGGATIQAVGQSPLGIYRAGTLSSPSGTFTLTLTRPGNGMALDYVIRAKTPPSSAFATTEVVYTLPATPDTPVAQIFCAQRELVTGIVRDSGGIPQRNVEVTGRPRDPRMQTPRTLTGTDGTFTLPLDPGDFDLDLVPPRGSRAPELTAPLAMDARGTSLAFTLGRAALIAGELTNAGTRTNNFAGATIRFYRPTEDGNVFIGSALVDDSNHFAAALPAR